MPDITMCSQYNCELKEECYRYTAKPNPVWQSYFCPETYGVDCTSFWEHKVKINHAMKGVDNA
jgi:hypothetical protein